MGLNRDFELYIIALESSNYRLLIFSSTNFGRQSFSRRYMVQGFIGRKLEKEDAVRKGRGKLVTVTTNFTTLKGNQITLLITTQQK